MTLKTHAEIFRALLGGETLTNRAGLSVRMDDSGMVRGIAPKTGILVRLYDNYLSIAEDYWAVDAAEELPREIDTADAG